MTVSCSNKTKTVALTSLDLSFMIQGYGTPQKDKSVTGKPITIAGIVYKTGLGTHSVSQLDIDLKRKGVRFTAFTGIDDDVNGKQV